MITNHCNHCNKDFEMRIHSQLCVRCFIAGHRGRMCDRYCKTKPPQTDPRVAKALAIIYDVDEAGKDLG